jgi:hypothetical protein
MKKHTVSAALAAAFAAALIAASPASAAHATRHHTPAQSSSVSDVNDTGTSTSAPTFGDLQEVEHPGCYDSRMQVPTVGGGLQWEPDLECNYEQ